VRGQRGGRGELRVLVSCTQVEITCQVGSAPLQHNHRTLAAEWRELLARTVECSRQEADLGQQAGARIVGGIMRLPASLVSTGTR